MAKDNHTLLVKTLLILLAVVIIALVFKLIGVTSTSLFYPLLIIIILLLLIFGALVFHMSLLIKSIKHEQFNPYTRVLKPAKIDKKSLADEEEKLFSEILSKLDKI